MSTRPVRARLVYVADPTDELMVVVPLTVTPAGVAETVTAVGRAILRPIESANVRDGWVVRFAPLGPPTGCVVMFIEPTTPSETVSDNALVVTEPTLLVATTWYEMADVETVGAPASAPVVALNVRPLGNAPEGWIEYVT